MHLSLEYHLNMPNRNKIIFSIFTILLAILIAERLYP